jgi:hypothetical protein
MTIRYSLTALENSDHSLSTIRQKMRNYFVLLLGYGGDYKISSADTFFIRVHYALAKLLIFLLRAWVRVEANLFLSLLPASINFGILTT